MFIKFGKIYSLSRSLYLKKIPYLPRILRAMNRIVYACDIPFKANIHETVIFAHSGLGVVVNDNAEIGQNTKILQHVTIGGNMGKQKEVDGRVTSAPVIGESVIIGAGAQILGPVKIGNNAKIGAGAVVMIDVPDNGIAVGIPAKVINAKEVVNN